MMRFPGLKKYQAKAALTMSKNQLDKAIVLLEVSNCYRKEIAQKKMNSAYLKNIHINLRYDVEAQDPALRNIVFESSVCRGANESSSSVKKASCGSKLRLHN
ncbi:hypothetical protein BDFB_001811 [Asbolus verrucosus]|uniref:Uncharacterized protein n=1 Tax=Asbolus verrucosus TaxID=1661398 RepID=A0A482V213_ASBVE|nr:hypothetical protein BDFB_001811 [Asbolus verrucosus]